MKLAYRSNRATQREARFKAGRFLSLGVIRKIARCNTRQVMDNLMPATVMVPKMESWMSAVRYEIG
jgi:hypothetical protein